jgi:DNA-binding GntR family transcriptional regulator
MSKSPKSHPANIVGSAGAENGAVAAHALVAVETSSDRTSNTLRAYREIRRRIFDNEMPPNSRFLEQELAELLHMSRTPVREALIRLEEERLVEVRPRHGVRVLPVSAADMREIYEVLTELEAAAARRLAERGADNATLKAMESAVAEMGAALAAGDLMRWAAADQAFHEALIDGAGNKRLAEVVRLFCDQSHRTRMQTLSLRPAPHASNRDHAALIEAIKRRDPAEAHRIHHGHRQRAGGILAELLGRAEMRS